MKNKDIVVNLPDGGRLVARACQLDDYPGISIDYENDKKDVGEALSTPTVLMEHCPGKGLRALVWADKNSEDFSHEIRFDT